MIAQQYCITIIDINNTTDTPKEKFVWSYTTKESKLFTVRGFSVYTVDNVYELSKLSKRLQSYLGHQLYTAHTYQQTPGPIYGFGYMHTSYFPNIQNYEQENNKKLNISWRFEPAKTSSSDE